MSWLALPGGRQLVEAAARGPATIDVENVAGDVTGGIRGEEDDRPFEILRLAEAPHRRAADGLDACTGGGFEDLAHQLGAIEVRRRDGVYADAFAGVFNGEHAGERI